MRFEKVKNIFLNAILLQLKRKITAKINIITNYLHMKIKIFKLNVQRLFNYKNYKIREFNILILL